MPHYAPPLRDLQFVLHEVFGVAREFSTQPAYANVDTETIDVVLGEAGKFAASVLAPLNRLGDEEGCTLDPETHEVTTPTGFKEAYQRYVEAGWPALSCDSAYGGQGLPITLRLCVYEMLNSANQAFTMYPGLSIGAYECLTVHGTSEQRALYLPKLAAGEWTATMCLTEANCGTDLGMLRTQAVPYGDGYAITGSKIFISSGEHDLATNIVHLVLARLPDSPPGSKGLSLFVAPKFLVNADGSLGARNPIFCGALEHKMGIHGNSTCQLNFDGAAGWLIGEPHKGLAAMFVMMNNARLDVAVQSLGLTEVAYQNALAYARERIQMRSISGTKSPDQAADPIIVHADVRQKLLTARAYAEGGRALAIWTALMIDKEHASPNESVKRSAARQVALLTPIAKAFLSDNAWIATSDCMQVYGGHGYIRESGVEQFVRDSRITMIYEGTNAIQALDLLGRKVLADDGAGLKAFGKQVEAFIEEAAAVEAMREFVGPLAELWQKVNTLTADLAIKGLQNRDEVGAAAVNYLRVCGHLVFAYLWARMAKVALAKLTSHDPFYRAKLVAARFYFAKLLPETSSLIQSALSGAPSVMDDDAFIV
ncbi:MAG: acyl-CoA dehydrogenase C-terminal domain-containing protein [Luteimonas sp.]